MNSPQARFLHTLADHIDHHGLPVVNIATDFAGGWTLHVVDRDNTAAAMVAWARSCNIATLAAVAVHVAFSSQLGGAPLRVWGCIDALGDLTTVSTDDLAHYAQHGELPSGGAV